MMVPEIRFSELLKTCLTSEKKSDSMIRLIQWIMLANWKAFETVDRRKRTNVNQQKNTRHKQIN